MKYALLLSTALSLFAAMAHADDALVSAQQAYDAAWDAAPLAIPTATLIESRAAGFGIYTPRATHVYKPGEPVMIYSEPVGFGYKDAGEGKYTFGFTLDLAIAQADGTEAFRQDGWQHVELTSRTKNHEFMLTIDLDFGATPPPAGDYVLNFTIHDMNSTETAPISLPITISE